MKSKDSTLRALPTISHIDFLLFSLIYALYFVVREVNLFQETTICIMKDIRHAHWLFLLFFWTWRLCILLL